MKNSSIKRLVFYALLLLVLSSVFLFQNSKGKMISATYTNYLDTVCEITVFSKSDMPLKVCETYLKFAEREFSAEDEDSTLYKMNNQQNALPSDELKNLIITGEEFSNRHPYYFSIHLDELLKTWNITGFPEAVPSPESIETALKSEKINLGAIAKGHITDKLVEKLNENGVDSALINLGGNTYALGKKSTGENWKIGIQDPKAESNIIGTISTENLAVVTSGDYQRYAEINGKRYHHIFDPKTGYPADSGLRSVTVICKDATTADALSTAAFVAGVEDGNKLLREYGAMGIFITDDTIYFSKALENIFTQLDFSYRYEFLY